MPATVLLPPSTTVYVTAMSNAAYLQQLTLTPPGGGTPLVWQGTGENDTILGQTTLNTPSGLQDQAYVVNAQYSTDNGQTWQQSTLLPGGCTIGTLNMQVLLSEDGVDTDFNDAVLQFIWWEPLS